MDKKKKLLIAAACLLLFLVGAAAIISVVEISPLTLKNALTERAEAALGMPVSADKISLRLYRGAVIHNLTLGSPGSEVFTAEKITIKSNFLQLVKRRIDIEQIIIEKPIIIIDPDNFFLPALLPVHVEESGAGISLTLKAVKLKGGSLKLRNEHDEPPGLICEDILIEARSEEDGGPVQFAFSAVLLESGALEASGSISSIENPRLEMHSAFTVDWQKLQQALSRQEIPGRAYPGGRKETVLYMAVEGTPENLKIELTTDMTPAEISYGGFFLKPADAAAAVSASARLLFPVLEIENASLSLGESKFTASGAVRFDDSTAALQTHGEINLKDASGFFPAASNSGAGGSAALQISLGKDASSSLSAEGECTVREWRFSGIGGDTLNFKISASEQGLEITDITGTVGQGQLTGSGSITQEGEYEFNIEGISIDLEELIRPRQNSAVRITGEAALSASIGGSAGSFTSLRGGGYFQAEEGAVHSIPVDEASPIYSNISRLLPFRYEKIRADFLIQQGIMRADALLQSENIGVTTETAGINLPAMTKHVKADITLSPSLLAKNRDVLGAVQNFLYIDGDGYAHIGLVWDGPLRETTPDLSASLLRTAEKRLRARLRR